MSHYPIYRKYKDKNIWYKLISAVQVVVAFTGDSEPENDKASLSIANILSYVMNDEYTESCSAQDFAKAYGEVMWKLVKTNDIQ